MPDLRGFEVMISLSGGLNPKAVAGSPSVTRFTHKSCTGFKTSGIPIKYEYVKTRSSSKIFINSQFLDHYNQLSKSSKNMEIRLRRNSFSISHCFHVNLHEGICALQCMHIWCLRTQIRSYQAIQVSHEPGMFRFPWFLLVFDSYSVWDMSVEFAHICEYAVIFQYGDQVCPFELLIQHILHKSILLERNSLPMRAAKKMATTSPMLEDTMYRMNCFVLAKMARPSPIAATMDAKLSSANTMSAACLATAVPIIKNQISHIK